MCQYFKILKVIINLVVISVCVGKIALFDKALALALARGALAMCAMWVGLSVGSLVLSIFRFSVFSQWFTFQFIVVSVFFYTWR